MMVDLKSMAFAAAVAAAATGGKADVVQTDAHRPVTYRFAVTNDTQTVQTVEAVRVSCACLEAEDISGREIAPGGELDFEVDFNPAGMEGRVEKRVWVELAPSKKTATFDIAADVRLRLGLKPQEAAFGAIPRSGPGREIRAALAGYAASGATVGEPVLLGQGVLKTACCEEEAAPREVSQKPVFDVRLAPDGRGVTASFAGGRIPPPGIYAQTWIVPADDEEVPEIRFVATARVVDSLNVTPAAISVCAGERRPSRFAIVRGAKVVSARTLPRKWAGVKVSQHGRDAWRIDVSQIDIAAALPMENPFLEIETEHPGMERFAIPLEILEEGGAK